MLSESSRSGIRVCCRWVLGTWSPKWPIWIEGHSWLMKAPMMHHVVSDSVIENCTLRASVGSKETDRRKEISRRRRICILFIFRLKWQLQYILKKKLHYNLLTSLHNFRNQKMNNNIVGYAFKSSNIYIYLLLILWKNYFFEKHLIWIRFIFKFDIFKNKVRFDLIL
jgi:hypothetical protein